MSLFNDLKVLRRGWRWGRRRLVPSSVPLPHPSTREFPTKWARTPAARMARKVILGAGFAPLLRFELSKNVTGLDVLESLDPPVVFVANHTSHLDAPVVMTSLPGPWRERTAVGAAADYFFDVWWRAAGTALAFNAFPVAREGARRSAGLGGRLLSEGWNILVFPQGTRSRDGWITEWKAGAAALASAAGVPVVPISLRGNYQAMPKGRGWPAPGRPPVSVRFGRPVVPEGGEAVRDFSSRILRGLQSTMEEDRSSWWGSLSNTQDASGPDAARWRRIWEASRPIDRKERVFK